MRFIYSRYNSQVTDNCSVNLLRRRSVYPHHHCVVPLVWLQGHLLLGLHLLCLHLLHLPGKHGLRLGCGVNTVGLYGDDKMASILEEVLRVKRHNPRLVWLSNVSEYTGRLLVILLFNFC